MCEPTTLLLGALTLGGGILQGVGAAGELENSAQNYEMAATGLDRDIAAERESSAYEIARTREAIARTQGSARAGFASSGLALSGSAAEVLRENQIEGELDVAAIQWNSKVKADNLAYERDVNRYNAQKARKGKGLAFISPVIGAAAKFGGSFG